jgi:hypothetical protein
MDEIAYPAPPLPDYYTAPYKGVSGCCHVCGQVIILPPRSATPFADLIRLTLAIKSKMQLGRPPRMSTTKARAIKRQPLQRPARTSPPYDPSDTQTHVAPPPYPTDSPGDLVGCPACHGGSAKVAACELCNGAWYISPALAATYLPFATARGVAEAQKDRERQQRVPIKQQEEWEVFVERIDDMLADGAWYWAEDTLEGIRDTVRERHAVTERQARAVENIENARRTRD